EAEVLAVYGRSPIGLGAESRIPLEIYTTRDTLAEGVIWKVDDINQLPEDSALTQLIQVDGIRAVLSAPLTASGELVGSLNLGSYEPACFDLVHQEIASEVANSLAIAIHSARLLETVTGHRQELQRLSNRLVTIQEEERKQISYELHDEIGQVLTAITYNLAAIRRDIPEEVVYLRAEARLSDTEELVRQVMERTRSMSLRLRPSMLQDLGLVPTLRWYINQYGIRMDTEVEFTADSIDPELPETIATMLYRFIQEGLTNAARYSGANRIAVTLVHDDGCIRAIVEDDGIGFEPDGAIGIQSPNTGTGLLGIRERVSSLGGRLDIETTLGEGTRLIAEVPLGESDEKN
ncbi:MAG TPA: GAF domain-containing sensor histidine kinase, partial [candidate division Zixibacteria bacterium]|nr:GAF domain-containing sensor histidine kinase [candidate division Zixibacteria bacterium]